MRSASRDLETKPTMTLAIAGEVRAFPTIPEWTTAAAASAVVAKLARGQRLLPRAMEP